MFHEILIMNINLIYSVFASTTLAEFSIWTREAGAGGLSIAVEGPSKAEISFEDRKDGSCGVSYIVKEPGTTFSNHKCKISLICMFYLNSRLINFSVIHSYILRFI